MLLLRAETTTGETIEFYFNEILEVFEDYAEISRGDNEIIGIVNNTVEAVAEDTDHMVK